MKVAAIDVGTNSIHLMVVSISPSGEITLVEKAREQVMLGSGGLSQAFIAPDAFERGVAALERFRAAADSHDCEDIHAGATSAVREASNGQEFCEAVKARTGIHVRQISGNDEARLIYLGARADLDFSRGRVLIFDVGGGSTEFILAEPRGPLMTLSLRLGHIRLTEGAPETAFTPDTRRAMKRQVRQVLQALKTRVRPEDVGMVVGTSGTVRTLARIGTLARGEQLPAHGSGLLLHRSEVEEFIKLAERGDPEALAAVPGMDQRRLATLPAGAVIVREVLKAVGVSQLVTSERSLRDGLIIDWIERHRPEIDLQRTALDPRERSTLAAVGRFCPDPTHARHVADLTLTLFDRLTALHQLPAADRPLAWSAAMLHDIGHHIAGKSHHRHGMYLLQHIRMAGFTAPEIAVLANIVRYHSRSKPKAHHPDFAALSADDQRRVEVIAGLLRLADSLDRSHEQPVRSIDVSWDDGAVRLNATLREGGELEHWAFEQRKDLLERALQRKVQLSIRHPEAPAAADDLSQP